MQTAIIFFTEEKIESMVDVRLITIEADQKGDLTTYNVYFTSCLTKQKQTS